LTPAGRLKLGVGADRLESDNEKTGIPFDAPPARYGRITEAVRILKAFLGGEEAVSLDRTHYRLQALDAFPGPRGTTRGLQVHPARRTMS